MPNNDPAIEIPDQPLPVIPDWALEQVDPPNLAEPLDNYKIRERETELQRKEHELQVERVMLDERKRYAFRLFGLSFFWLLFIGVYLILAGMSFLKAADSVLIALITTTTANVLGLFYIVARWLFPNKGNNESVAQTKPAQVKKMQPKKGPAKNA